MFITKKRMAVAACLMVFSAISMLPGEFSFISSAHAKDGGGNGGGGAGGHGGSSGSGGSGHSGGTGSNGQSNGLSSDHDGKAVRDRGVSGQHIGNALTDKDDRGSITSGVAHSKNTRGLSKATSISGTTPGDHNAKGLSNAAISTTKQDR